MGLSLSLLAVAALTALVPVALIGLRAPDTIRDLEKAVVSGVVVLVVGGIVVHGFHRLDFFGIVHLGYLLAVVSVPLLLGSWFVLSHRHGRRRIDSIMGAVAALVAVCGLYGTHVEPNWLRIDRAELVADVAAPLRIGVLADLQTPQIGQHERDAVTELLAQRPDLVVVPGDWYQGHPDAIEAERAAFVGELRRLVDGARLVAVVSGDSDGALLPAMVTEAGALFIDDTVVSFELDGIPIRLAGLPVRSSGADRSNVIATLAEPTNALSLLVAHRPDVVYELTPDTDVDLVISGHTHGGQIQVPFVGPIVTFSDVPRSLAAGGLETVDNVPVYVSVGVGLERLQAPQVRFGARPEIGIIDVVPR